MNREPLYVMTHMLDDEFRGGKICSDPIRSETIQNPK
jgi:hypothetical protein